MGMFSEIARENERVWIRARLLADIERRMAQYKDAPEALKALNDLSDDIINATAQ